MILEIAVGQNSNGTAKGVWEENLEADFCDRPCVHPPHPRGRGGQLACCTSCLHWMLMNDSFSNVPPIFLKGTKEAAWCGDTHGWQITATQVTVSGQSPSAGTRQDSDSPNKVSGWKWVKQTCDWQLPLHSGVQSIFCPLNLCDRIGGAIVMQADIGAPHAEAQPAAESPLQWCRD